MRAKTHWQESNDLEMMFQGTYTSDFYRAVRNLLHDQVSLQTADVPLPPERDRAVDAIEHRWQELLTNELKYRSPGTLSAATA
jgi:anaerobic magnesium-protoporphyrin IX monomethyl ester cyclase